MIGKGDVIALGQKREHLQEKKTSYVFAFHMITSRAPKKLKHTSIKAKFS